VPHAGVFNRVRWFHAVLLPLPLTRVQPSISGDTYPASQVRVGAGSLRHRASISARKSANSLSENMRYCSRASIMSFLDGSARPTAAKVSRTFCATVRRHSLGRFGAGPLALPQQSSWRRKPLIQNPFKTVRSLTPGSSPDLDPELTLDSYPFA